MQESFKMLQRLLLSSGKINSKAEFIKFANDNNFSKLGDSIANLFYSIAKTQVMQRATGAKVSDAILCAAYKNSEHFRKDIYLKGRRDYLADRIEAVILATWLGQILTADEIISVISNNLNKEDLKNYASEKRIATKAFGILLDLILVKLNENFEKS